MKFLEKRWSELLLAVLIIVVAIALFIPGFVGIARYMWQWALYETI